MASEVGICNSALIKLGADTIMSLTDGSRNAKLCNEQYVKLRDGLLRAHTWNFAIRRQKLARLSDAPAFGFDFAYQLPSDWLRTVSAHDNDAGRGAVRYRIEGSALLSNAEAIWLRYIHRVIDPNDMPPSFQEALAWRIAVDLSQPVTQSSTIMELMDRKFGPALITAKSIDAIEDFPDEMPESDWVTARG